MAKPDGEAFLFYFERWTGSRPIQRMSFGERGMYLEILIQQWKDGDLPDSASEVAELITTSDAQARELEAAWPTLRRNFVANAAGRIQNLRLEEIRRQRRAWLRKQAISGARGGRASARNRLTKPELSLQQPYGDPIPIEQLEVEEVDQKKKELEGEQQEMYVEALTRSTPTILTFPTVGAAKAWPLTKAQVDTWATLYPGLDIEAEARKALAWVSANPQKRKTARGMSTFLVNWFNRAVNSSNGRRSPPADGLSDTARFNLQSKKEAERIVLEMEAQRTGTHGHSRQH